MPVANSTTRRKLIKTRGSGTIVKTVTTIVPNKPASVSSDESTESFQDDRANSKILARGPPSQAPLAEATRLKKSVFRNVYEKSLADPKNKVTSSGGRVSNVKVPGVRTKRGLEPVLQQAVVEKIIQRTPKLQYTSRYVKGIDTKDGKAKQVEISQHTIDPAYGTNMEGINETISVTSGISVTPRGKIIKKEIKRKTFKSEALETSPSMNVKQISRLIQEENEDVENTLRMVPPNLISYAVEKYPLKKKLQMLRLTSESMAILEQRLVRPMPTADEVETEASPEVMATLLHAIEKGASPKSSPNQIFNSLFPDVKDKGIRIGSVAPGPLQDVMVPIEAPRAITEEVLNDEMEKAVMEVQNVPDQPRTDICTEQNIKPPKRTPKGQQKKPVMIGSEVPPWEVDDVKNVSELVGSDPIFNIEPMDTTILNTSQDPMAELANGIDYLLNADTNVFETKVQLRGSRPPSWFPGYVSVFPHLPNLMKINRTPSVVLHTAWRLAQPRSFPDDCVLIV